MPLSRYDFDGIIPGVTHEVVFVDSNASNASDGNFGGLNEPLATLDGAVNRLSGESAANKGGLIVLMPNHAETITAAAGADLDVAGITVMGLGNGDDRPTITFTTATTADIDIDAAGVKIKNVIFVCGIASQVAMIDVNADDFTIEDCEFRESSATGLTAIDINGGAANGCDRATVRRCTFRLDTAGNWDRAIELGEVADGVLIEDCDIYGDFDDAAIHNPTAKVLTNLRIRRCSIQNAQAGQHAVELVSACTGWIEDVKLYTDAIATAADLGSLKAANCWYFDTSNTDVAATPYPVTTTTGGINFDQITDALYGSNGVVTWASGAAAGNGVSISEALRYTQETVINALFDSTGIASFPAAAAPANSVSIAEVLRAVYDRQLGDGTDASTNTLLGKRVTRTTADVLTSAAVPIFTISSGQVLVTALIGEVTTVIGTGTTPDAKFQMNPTTGTTVDLCATLQINDDEVGTLYSITGTPSDAMLVGSSGAVRNMSSGGVICDIGDIEFICDEDVTGSIKFTLFYIPLEDGATVAAA